MTSVVVERGGRFPDLLAAEWIKLRSLRSTWWVLGVCALAAVGIDVNSAVDAYHEWPRMAASPGWIDPHVYTFTHTATGILMLAAGSVGAVMIVGEYGSGLIRTTFAATPARATVVIAKAAVLVAVFAVVGTVVAVASFLSAQRILDGRGVEMSLLHLRSLRATAAVALLPVVSALIGLGLGALVRHTAAAVAVTGGVLLILPTFFTPFSENALNARISALMPTIASSRLILSESLFDVPEGFPPTVAGSWLVYLAWSMVAVAAALVMVRRREP